MDKAQFERELKSDGYVEIETKDYVGRPANNEHGHDFSVRGLVLEGRFTVIQDRRPTTYLPGQIFSVAKGDPHSEEIAAEGARVLVGRKYEA